MERGSIHEGLLNLQHGHDVEYPEVLMCENRTLSALTLDETIADADLRTRIFAAIPRPDLQAEMDDTARLLEPLDSTGYAFLLQSYLTIHRFTAKFLAAFTFHANTASAPILTAVTALHTALTTGKHRVPNTAPLTFASPRWLTYILEDNGAINTKYYELAVLWEVRAALRAGNVWVEGSRRYADLDSYLIPRDKWPDLREEVCRQIGATPDAAARLNVMRDEMDGLLTRVAALLGPDETLRIENGAFVLSPLTADPASEKAKVLAADVGVRLPLLDLSALLMEVDGWTHFSDCFVHASGTEPRNSDQREHIYAAIIAQACNLGVQRMARASGLSENQLSWYTNWYLREETLRAANTILINYQYHLPLAARWGNGTLSSSDGQRFPVPVKNRMATALPRYFAYGKGLTFYTWMANIHMQFGTKVISTTDRDSTHVLDGVNDNENELPLREHTTDTAGATDMSFGLFTILGYIFAPRIRDIGEQRLYRFDRLPDHPGFRPLIKGTINQALIVEHWDDLLRVAGSLKLGWVTASLLVSKLQSYPQQNMLTKVIQEFGHIAKTLFILRYYESEQYRRRIEAQLNKGENMHALREFIFFANRAHIRKRTPEEQTDQANCLTLVTNAIVTWNTVYIAAVLEQLKVDGYPLDEADIAHISPTRFAHINPFGRYHFDWQVEAARTTLRPLRPPPLKRPPRASAPESSTD